MKTDPTTKISWNDKDEADPATGPLRFRDLALGDWFLVGLEGIGRPKIKVNTGTYAAVTNGQHYSIDAECLVRLLPHVRILWS